MSHIPLRPRRLPTGAGKIACPFGSLRLRPFGPRPSVEDISVWSPSTSIVNGEAGGRFNDRFRVILEAFAIVDAEASAFDHDDTSRFPGEPVGGFDDVHLRRALPCSGPVSLQMGF